MILKMSLLLDRIIKILLPKYSQAPKLVDQETLRIFMGLAAVLLSKPVKMFNVPEVHANE